VHKRILFGIVAWLLGAATATAGCLLAVSLLGQGIGGNSSEQLTQDAVNRALASEVAENNSQAPQSAESSESPSPSKTAHPSSKPTRAATPATSEQSTPSSPPAASPTSTAGTASPGGTVLTSKGGEVVATCQPAGAYLLSWSPSQGYEVDNVSRGPAASARVSFESMTTGVTMVVTCSAGVPTATSRVDN
jgi:serine/threonine-protein kinase